MLRALVCTSLFCAGAFGQTALPKLSFDAAAIEASTAPPDQRLTADFKAGGRAELRNANLKQMINQAYDVPADMVIGGPAWMDSGKFDLVAKADPKSTVAELQRMLQTLLAERCHLKFHWGTKVVPVYALVVMKGGLKVKASAADAKQDCNRHALPGGTPGWAQLDCTKMTMDDLVAMLPRTAPAYFDLPVVNQTGVKGVYDWTLTWTGKLFLEGTKRDDQGNLLPAAGGFSIFDAVQKLGLKLEERKMPRPTVLVDSVDRAPVEN